MHFGDALNVLKEGKKVGRDGWNGKGMWITISSGFIIGADRIFSPVIRSELERNDAHGVFHPYIMMKTVDGGFIPWVASQTDLLADDWSIA